MHEVTTRSLCMMRTALNDELGYFIFQRHLDNGCLASLYVALRS